MDYGKVSGKNARLVCKGDTKDEGIDYDETFTLVARLEVVRTLLAYATHKGFKVYQMDVLVEIFVDDTFFTGNDDQCKEFSEHMNKEFEMSMFGEI